MFCRTAFVLLGFILAGLSEAHSSDLAYKNTQLGIISIEEINLVPYFSAKSYGPYWVGAISSGKSAIYAVNAAGDILKIDRKTKEITALDIKYQNNRDDFVKEIRATGVTKFWANNFRFTDLLVFDNQPSDQIFASTIYWHIDKKCYSMQLISISPPEAEWKVLFESSPCLRLDTPGTYFIGQESGGRIARQPTDKILLSIGHFGYDGRDKRPNFPQDPSANYGKILEIDPATGEAEIISRGHRNPQGLTLAEDGTIWSTEHGPEGGDELNKIIRGNNYGWPNETLGVDYGEKVWQLNAKVGRHDATTMPTFAWVPSIGVSNLIQVKNFDSRWDGDLIVGSLRGNSLYRLRLAGDRVVYAEQIDMGERIRDLDQTDSGEILVLLDNGTLLILRATDLNANQLAPQVANAELASVINNCTVCHSFAKGMDTTVAPGLWGVVGRKVASTKFPNYSSSMKRKGASGMKTRLISYLKIQPNSFLVLLWSQFRALRIRT